MKKYHIYHSIGDNKFIEDETQPKRFAGYVQADSLEDAFRNSQNRDSDWNLNKPCRSTSIGDVILNDEGMYMVCSIGFRLLDTLSKNDSELNGFESQISN